MSECNHVQSSEGQDSKGTFLMYYWKTTQHNKLFHECHTCPQFSHDYNEEGRNMNASQTYSNLLSWKIAWSCDNNPASGILCKSHYTGSSTVILESEELAGES